MCLCSSLSGISSSLKIDMTAISHNTLVNKKIKSGQYFMSVHSIIVLYLLVNQIQLCCVKVVCHRLKAKT